MKKSYLVLLFFLYGSFAIACEIFTYDHLIINEQIEATQNSLIKQSTCKQKLLQHFYKTLTGIQATIDSQKLNSLMEGNEKVNLKPSKVFVEGLGEFLRKNIKVKNQDITFENINVLNRSAGFGIDRSTPHQVYCSNCDRPGLKNISIKRKGSNPIWLTSKLKFKVMSVIAMENIGPSMQSISEFALTLRPIYTDRPENYFTNLDIIKFYKPSRPIVKGSPITIRDVSKMHLVKMGRPITVILGGKGFNISSTGMPMTNAGLHESIQVKNLKTNKIINGEVIDFNKVKVNL